MHAAGRHREHALGPGVLPPMNILLTGGLGYIGSHTAVVLAQAGHRVVLLDNLSNSRADVAIESRPVDFT